MECQEKVIAKDVPDSGSTQSTLVERVKSWEDQESWETFFQIYQPLIHSFSIKSGLTHDEAQEVAQDTLIEVARRIRNREYDRKQGSFRAWLYRLTRWRIANQFHKRQNGFISLTQFEMTDGSGLKGSELLLAEASEVWEEDWRQALLDAAMERLRACLKPQHHQVLHALVCQGWPVAKVAHVLRMSRGQVYLIKFRSMAQLKEQMAHLEKAQIQ